MGAAVDCFERPLLMGSERLGMRHGMVVCIQVLVWIASRVEAHEQVELDRQWTCRVRLRRCLCGSIGASSIMSLNQEIIALTS